MRIALRTLWVLGMIAAAAWAPGCGQERDSWADVRGAIPDLPSPPAEVGYHWDGMADPFFEGWYFKVSDPGSGVSFFFIYGVIAPGDPAAGEAFVQVGGGPDHEYLYVPFPLDEFHAKASRLDVRVGEKNAATAAHIMGEIAGTGLSASWDLAIESQIAWERTMGDLTDAPGLPVWWNVVHLRALAHGTVTWNGRRFDLADAVAYADHNWGEAFPEYWMWLQAGHFENGADAIAATGGLVRSPWGNAQAFMVGFFRDFELLAFRTQDGDPIGGSYADQVWTLEAIEGDRRLTLWATADPTTLMTLLGPTAEGMRPILSESVVGRIAVTYWERAGADWRAVDTRLSDLAGVEVGGVWP